MCRAPSLSGLGSWLQGHRPAHLGLGWALGPEGRNHGKAPVPAQSPAVPPRGTRTRCRLGTRAAAARGGNASLVPLGLQDAGGLRVRGHGSGGHRQQEGRAGQAHTHPSLSVSSEMWRVMEGVRDILPGPSGSLRPRCSLRHAALHGKRTGVSRPRAAGTPGHPDCPRGRSRCRCRCVREPGAGGSARGRGAEPGCKHEARSGAGPARRPSRLGAAAGAGRKAGGWGRRRSVRRAGPARGGGGVRVRTVPAPGLRRKTPPAVPGQSRSGAGLCQGRARQDPQPRGGRGSPGGRTHLCDPPHPARAVPGPESGSAGAAPPAPAARRGPSAFSFLPSLFPLHRPQASQSSRGGLRLLRAGGGPGGGPPGHPARGPRPPRDSPTAPARPGTRSRRRRVPGLPPPAPAKRRGSAWVRSLPRPAAGRAGGKHRPPPAPPSPPAASRYRGRRDLPSQSPSFPLRPRSPGPAAGRAVGLRLAGARARGRGAGPDRRHKAGREAPGAPPSPRRCPVPRVLRWGHAAAAQGGGTGGG